MAKKRKLYLYEALELRAEPLLVTFGMIFSFDKLVLHFYYCNTPRQKCQRGRR